MTAANCLRIARGAMEVALACGRERVVDDRTIAKHAYKLAERADFVHDLLQCFNSPAL